MLGRIKGFFRSLFGLWGKKGNGAHVLVIEDWALPFLEPEEWEDDMSRMRALVDYVEREGKDISFIFAGTFLSTLTMPAFYYWLSYLAAKMSRGGDVIPTIFFSSEEYVGYTIIPQQYAVGEVWRVWIQKNGVKGATLSVSLYFDKEGPKLLFGDVLDSSTHFVVAADMYEEGILQETVRGIIEGFFEARKEAESRYH